MSATIDDVARRAGVSKKTVSRVMNHEPHVSQPLQARVLAAIQELNYSPNIAARRLASNCAFVIGLLYGGAPGEYFSQIMHAILDLGLPDDYTLLVSNFVPHDPASRARIAGFVKNKHADGLILTSPCDNDEVLLAHLQAAAFPCVRLTPADWSSPLPYVAATDRRGAYDVAEYLIGLGHRRIAFVWGDTSHQASHERFEGFRAALCDHGVPLQPGWITRADHRFDLGVKAGRQLLQTRPRPTAIVAGNDESAAGVLVAAHELGVRVPEELSVTGFDDFPAAQKTYPALTTVRQPVAEISKLATQLLIELIHKHEPEILHRHVPTTLVVRESTGPCTVP